jgi:hypothetical protein
VLVVAGAVVLGACALAFVVVTRLRPCAPLLPTWVTLAAAGLLLPVLGASFERLQQPREAVAWPAQLSRAGPAARP